MTVNSALITGVGASVPERIVTNHDLAAILPTSDEWIQERTGIKERRFIDPASTPSDLAYQASLKALSQASLEPKDIEFILVATLSPERYFPGTVSFLQAKLGLETTPGFDLRAQCSGFIYGLQMARALVLSGQFRRILLVGVEVQSPALDLTERGRDMAVLFGDGAGAVVIEASEAPEQGIIRVLTRLEGTNADKLWCPSPRIGGRAPSWVTTEDIARGDTHPKMDGKYVFKNAVKRMPEVIKDILSAEKLSKEQIDFWLFHQANLRINDFIAQSLELSSSKTHNNIQKYGNTSAASLPILLDECISQGRIKKGHLICLTAFGAGFTWGSALVRM